MRLALMFAALCVSLPLVAQISVCMGGNLDRLNAVERRVCEDGVRATRDAANEAPADWHFVVVCSEDGWKDYMSFSDRGEDALRGASIDIDLASRTTFLRGSRVTSLAAAAEMLAPTLTLPARSAALARD